MKASAITAFILSAFISNTVIAQQTNPQRPNVVFILSDDHAYQAISAYGSKLARTPNIDRIAREGALFKNTFITQFHLWAEQGLPPDR